MSTMSMRRIILLLCLGCLTQANVRGQTLSEHKALGRYQQLVWQDQHGLPHNFATAVFEDSKGSLWIGTNGGGLRRFKNGRFAAITVRDGLFDNRTFQILSDTEDDSGDLWLNGNWARRAGLAGHRRARADSGRRAYDPFHAGSGHDRDGAD